MHNSSIDLASVNRNGGSEGFEAGTDVEGSWSALLVEASGARAGRDDKVSDSSEACSEDCARLEGSASDFLICL